MPSSDEKRCGECGEPLPPGTAACPFCSLGDLPAAASGAGSELSGAGLTGLLEAMQGSSSSVYRLAECESCERLIETQEYLGLPIQPEFCPWCGDPLVEMIGREIDGYRIDALLAQGGFGVLYLASNIAEPKMKAAVKFLRPHIVYHRPELIRILVEEARLTEEISRHSWNVVRVSNVREKPWPYYFMEYLRGKTLDAVLREAGKTRLSLEDSKGYMRGIAKALAATHARGRVHRDLKPLNLMVIEEEEVKDPEARIKLVDFGLAMKIAGAGASVDAGASSGESTMLERQDLASPLESAGTPEYMPPEAFERLNQFSGDIYSFGVTAYEILTGQSPWPQPPDRSRRVDYWKETHKTKPPRPLREVRPEVPSWLSRVVMDCLEKDPVRRPETAEELLRRLREPLPRWVWASAAAAILLVGALVYLAILGGGEKQGIRWSHRGERSEGDSLQLFVKDAASLAETKLLAEAVDGREIVACEADLPGVAFEIKDGKASVTFVKGPALASLLGSTVTISGKGKGFRLEGAVEILEDSTPPEVGEIKLRRDGGPPEALPGKPRLQREKATLAVVVREEHLRSVTFRIPTVHDQPEASQKGTRVKGQDGELWELDLSHLTHGKTYRVWVEAEDEAGNKSKSPSEEVRFTVDEKASLVLVDEKAQKFFAKRRAFYEILLGDDEDHITDLKVLRGGAGEEVSWEILEDEERTALDVTGEFTSLERIRDPARLEPKKRYLLAVPAGKGGGSESFTLIAQDSALPPNEAAHTLKLRAPPPLSRERDIERISIRFEGEDVPVDLELPDFKLRHPTRRSRIEVLRVSFAEGAIHGALCKRGREVVTAQLVEPRSLEIRGIQLEADAGRERTENQLLLELLDPLERSLSLPISVVTDLRPPEVKLDVDGKGKALRLLAISNEPLSRAVCTIAGQTLEWPAPDSSASTAVFEIGKLDLKDGRYSLNVKAWDLAGLEVKDSVPSQVVINTQRPKIVIPAVVKVDSKGTLKLDRNDFPFEVEEANDLDYDKAEIRFAIDGRSGVIRRKIERPANGSLHSVDLREVLGVSCAGTLTVFIADVDDLEAENAVWRFEFVPQRIRWAPEVTYRKLKWVLIPGSGDEKDFYILKHEVPNWAYLEAYLRGGLPRPLYFGEKGELPSFSRQGERVGGERFPVVGVRPEAAKRFGRSLGARLPTYEEWRRAAWKRNRGGKYPWKDSAAGEDYANCFDAWRKSPIFKLNHVDRTMVPGNKEERSRVECRAAEVDFDPFAQCSSEVRESLNYTGELLHMIGNVAEIVDLGRGAHGIAGGSFDSRYEKDIDLRTEESELREFQAPDAKTGFRLVIDPEAAPEEFKKAAGGAGKP